MTEENRGTETRKQGRQGAVIKIAVVAFLAFVCFLGYLFLSETREDTLKAGKDLIKSISGYQPVKVAETIEKDLTYILEEHNTGLNLELVRRTITGTIDKVYKKDYTIHIPHLYEGKFTFDGYAEIKCPVTYSYYVSLDGDWKIILKNSIVMVHAPGIETGNPQIDTSRLKERFEGNPIVFDRDMALKRLRSDLTREFKIIGEEQRSISYVREDCRRQVERFVRTWLLNKEHIEAVIVVFEDDEVLTQKAEVIEQDQEYLEIRKSVR